MLHFIVNAVIIIFAIIGFAVVAGLLVGYVLQLQGRGGREGTDPNGETDEVGRGDS